MARRLPNTMESSFADIRADYSAARDNRWQRRRTGVSVLGSGADYHYRHDGDYLRLMELARDMDRNDVVIGQMIGRAVDYTVQDGFTPNPQTGVPECDKLLTDLWWDWANDPEQVDVAGESAFCDFERLTLRATLVDGDVVHLLTDQGKLQPIEAHRVRTPTWNKKNVVHGVELDEMRRRIRYFVARDDLNPFGILKLADTAQYETRDTAGQRQLCHVFKASRFSQTRGITAMAPMFDTAGHFEDTNFAKLVQQKVVSCIAIFREMSLGAQVGNIEATGATTIDSQWDGSDRLMSELAPGMEIRGRPGEKLSGFSPNVPNAEFFQHVRLMLTLMGINLGLPLVLALMDSSETNFSGWRGAFEAAKLGFARNQEMLIRRFHRPTWVWWLRHQLTVSEELRGFYEKLGPKIFAVEWNPPGWPYIQPTEDAAADLLRARNGLSSRRRIANERRLDWGDLSTEIVEDNALAITKAMATASAINAQIKDPADRVSWREVLSMPTPDGVQIGVSPPAQKPQPNGGRPGRAEESDE